MLQLSFSRLEIMRGLCMYFNFPIFYALNELAALCKLVCDFEDDLRALTEKTFS